MAVLFCDGKTHKNLQSDLTHVVCVHGDWCMKLMKSNFNHYHFVLYFLQIFYDCLEMMREHPADGSKNILVLLLISAVLERSLGNVSTCLIFLISTFIMFAYLLKHDVIVLFSLGVQT